LELNPLAPTLVTKDGVTETNLPDWWKS